MGIRLEWDDDASEKILGAWDVFGEDHLGPEIAERAARYAPKRTGALADSVESHMNGHTLVVSATGDGEREYAAYVELGHRVFHPSTRTVGPEVVPPEPFLRPALFGGHAPTPSHERSSLGPHLQTRREGYTYLGRESGMYVYERNGHRVYSDEPPRSTGGEGPLVHRPSSQQEAYRRKVLREQGIDVDDPTEKRIPF